VECVLKLNGHMVQVQVWWNHKGTSDGGYFSPAFICTMKKVLALQLRYFKSSKLGVWWVTILRQEKLQVSRYSLSWEHFIDSFQMTKIFSDAPDLVELQMCQLFHNSCTTIHECHSHLCASDFEVWDLLVLTIIYYSEWAGSESWEYKIAAVITRCRLKDWV
jgi:hypothetical protein